MDRHPPGPLDALWWAVAAGQGPAALHHMPNSTQPGALLVTLDISLYWPEPPYFFCLWVARCSQGRLNGARIVQSVMMLKTS